MLGWVPKAESLTITAAGFYRLDELPVAQPTTSKH